MKPIQHSCVPGPEVLAGDLEDAIFAADFGQVLDGTAPPVYQESTTFGRYTHPALALKKIGGTVFGRLVDANDASLAVRLSTGFGRGKTNALISLWHQANSTSSPAFATDLLPAAAPVAMAASWSAACSFPPVFVFPVSASS